MPSMAAIYCTKRRGAALTELLIAGALLPIFFFVLPSLSLFDRLCDDKLKVSNAAYLLALQPRIDAAILGPIITERRISVAPSLPQHQWVEASARRGRLSHQVAILEVNDNISLQDLVIIGMAVGEPHLLREFANLQQQTAQLLASAW